jgi:NTP pyrophosphatase (non-canonical NTP hydrolase)
MTDLVQNLKAKPSDVRRNLAWLCDNELDILHGAIGLSTEAGELLDACKKMLFYGRPLDRLNVIEELGDIEWYLELIRAALGVTREQVIDANKKKLRVRYGGTWTAEAAANRDVAAEREAMEND